MSCIFLVPHLDKQNIFEYSIENQNKIFKGQLRFCSTALSVSQDCGGLQIFIELGITAIIAKLVQKQKNATSENGSSGLSLSL